MSVVKPDDLPTPVTFPAVDGFPLHGHVWGLDRAREHERAPVVIVNPATSVHSRYYRRFAEFLHARGFNVITYDYRGIGGSRPARMRGFEASWLDWGTLDFEAALRYAGARFPEHPVHVVAHSVGGFLIGLAPSNGVIQRVFTMGAQFAYWRDYVRHKRWLMFLRWHIVMPALTACFGYFPGRRLGWLEDTPRGVVRDWNARHPKFEDAYERGPRALTSRQRAQLVASFARMTGPTLAVSLSDDEFGTPAAIHRLLDYYHNSPSIHLQVEPGRLGEQSIGHFAFFHSRFADTLWQIPLAWLRDGKVPDHAPGRVMRSSTASASAASVKA